MFLLPNVVLISVISVRSVWIRNHQRGHCVALLLLVTTLNRSAENDSAAHLFTITTSFPDLEVLHPLISENVIFAHLHIWD